MKHKGLLLILLLLFGVTTGLLAQTYALDFDGNDAVSMGNLAFTGTSYTAECWIYPTSLPAMVTPNAPYCRTILASSQIAGSYPIWVGTTGTNLKVWSYSTNQDTGGVATVGLGLTTNTWYHIAVTTTKGGTTKLYVDGVEKLSFTNLGQGDNWNNIFTVGELRPGRLLGFYGKILGVRIWDSVLTPAQILYGMNNDLIGDESGLIGYWPFSEGSGTTAYDQVATPHNGTLGTVASGYDPAWTSGMPYVNLTSANPAISASSVAQGTTNLPLTRFTLTANGAASTLNTVSFTTSGTYVATDIENFRLFYSATDDLSSASQIGADITTTLGAGSHSFTGLTQSLSDGATRYFWITSDISASATGGNTIYVDAIMTSNLTVTSRFKTGTSSSGGVQTFDEILPVELSSFTAVLTVENYVTVKWITQSETGVSGYYIYRSIDSNWTNASAICSMIPSVNSPIQQVYQYTDNELEEDGTYYYWLEVQDLDGSSYSHGPTSVYFSNTGGGAVDTPPIPVAGINSIYPNPITPYSIISYTLTKSADVKFKVYNSRGQLVNSFNKGFLAANDYTTGWDGKDSDGINCPTGVYYIKLQAGKDSAIRKAVIVK